MAVLYVVATPIGNLEDITFRALRTLKEVDAIFCEDTRVTLKLLSHYGFRKPVYRCDERAERKAAERAIGLLTEEKNIALVSDAGTPCVSDPGAHIVRAVRGAGFSVVAIPGPSALTAALSIAGLYKGPSFIFLGFLPHKKGRQTTLKAIALEERPVILYESPHRIEKLMSELSTFAPDKKVMLFRELTKMYEEVLSGAPQELWARLETDGTARGEFVVIISSDSEKQN
jgi:16S rRNA (cytidine1402-2'-O)-methyltransferase